jgi:hypothetical protein
MTSANVAQAARRKQRGVHLDRIRAVDRPFRTCSRCRETLPADRFRLDARGFRRSHCIPCARQATNEWRERNRAELARRSRVAYRLKHPARPAPPNPSTDEESA